jgi:anaerobic glycerol-3-phosphate dehydrogenase
VNNDDVLQGLKTIFGDMDIHSSSNVVREKVGDLLLDMCSTLQNNSYDSISNYTMNYYMITVIGALKQMGT